MAARPDYLGTDHPDEATLPCPDCGSPMPAGPGSAYRICRGCYDAYVDNAGR